MMTTKTKTSKRPKGRPFKKFYCDRDDIFSLPSNAFKVWMFYYRLEGAKREGWAVRETICDKCDISLETLKTVKAWLIEHQWLRQVGTRETRSGGLIPIMQVTRGTIPAKSDGRGKSKKSKGTQFKQGRKVSTTASGGKLTPPPPAENLAPRGSNFSTRGGTNFSAGTGEETFPHDVDVSTEVDKNIDKTSVDGSVQGFQSVHKSKDKLSVLPAGLPPAQKGFHWEVVGRGDFQEVRDVANL